ncbi:MAG: acetyl-CoA C-acetyltransferase [Oscillospiraceae bacterium]|jgi:acetyl-CoA C-acetyltransferase|nr:acetyl-CoA C-acetyltransferase [Oscillospiraceae bacterium]
MSKKIVLAGACRTPIGKMGGVFVNTYTPELATIVVKEALKRSGVPAEAVDEVILGCVFQGGIGQNVARQASVYAGIPISTPAFTLNNLCGSGLKSINVAAGLIQSGQADVIVAGGAENMSNAPYLLKKARFGYRLNDGVLIDSMQNDGLWDTFHHYPMGITAENVAEKYGITREMQDEFSANSQQKCQKAIAEGKFNDEIVPVEVKQKKKTVLIDKDEPPRAGITAESLAHLKPCFKEGGTVTAANSSGINDAASAVIVMTEDKAKELGVKPMAYWIDGASAGVDPAYMGLGPIDATKKVMKHSGMSVKDMDLVEANEAFAAQSIEVCRELEFDMSKVNVNGGAIALGHPVGCSGCRILTTLMYEMQKRSSEYGLATLCVGGGMGVATIVKRYE